MSELLSQNTNPVLFIKPINSNKEGLKISDVMASQNDILITIANQLQIDYETIDGIGLLNPQGLDQKRTRYHYFAVVENTEQTKTRTYEINGTSLDFANWKATDEYHEFQYYK